MKKHHNLIYFLWYSIDPWGRDVLFTLLSSHGGRWPGSAAERRKRWKGSSMRWRTLRQVLAAPEALKQDWVLPAPCSQWHRCAPACPHRGRSDKCESVSVGVFFLLLINFNATGHLTVSVKACVTILEKLRRTVTTQTLRPADILTRLQSAPVPPQSCTCENQHFNTAEFPVSVAVLSWGV